MPEESVVSPAQTGGESSAISPDTARHISEMVATARRRYESGATRTLSWRRRQLLGLQRLLRECGTELEQALWADLHKNATESQLTEIGVVAGEVSYFLRNLSRLARPKITVASPMLQPAHASIISEPLGTALIIAPWNYPVQLLLGPLAGVLAAGNAAVLKPSELAPRTSAAIARLLPRYVDAEAVQVIEGAVAETAELLAQRFDHIVYTGNAQVARIVMRAAAEHLTPVTLELGGKSPAWVGSETGDLDTIADRIAWAKFTNAGQTCIAPDYILTTPSQMEPLVAALSRAILRRFGEDPSLSGEYGRVINEKHFDRLVSYLDGGDVRAGGRHDRGTRYIEPTILVMPPWVSGLHLRDDFHQDSSAETDRTGRDGSVAAGEELPSVMREEIFGPILPIVTVRDTREAIAFINAGEKPLALYVFGASRATERRFVAQTSSGAVGIGVALAHAGARSLPFGGIGQSGMGAYHGKYSWQQFSHAKPVLRKPLRPDTLRMIYQPVPDKLRDAIRRLSRRGF